MMEQLELFQLPAMGTLYQGDALEILRRLPSSSVHTCVTSPPYWGLRDYGVDGQIGLEETPEEYVEKLVAIFREVRRVLRDDGTLWLNLGDSYASGGRTTRAADRKSGAREMGVRPPTPFGLKPKDLVGIPWRVAFALQADGWYLRRDIIWHKPNAMPESVKDRPTTAHEYIFMMSKSPDYYYDAEAIMEPAVRAGDTQTFGGSKGRNYRPEEGDPNYRAGSEQWGRTITTGDKRNKRSVWTISTRPFKGAHFAVFPPDLIEPCILAGTPEKACPHCGAPWERVMERCGTVKVQNGPGKSKKIHVGQGKHGSTSTFNTGYMAVRKMKGWIPTCQCPDNDGSGPGIVLDPFFGSGTTGLVAQKHGRQWIGIELNPEYVEIAKKRLEVM